MSDWDDATTSDWGDVDDTFQLPRQPIEEAEMDITPMIDITFLLLIFFIVASHLDAAAEVTLPKARYGTAVATKNSVMLVMTAGTGDAAEIYKGEEIGDPNNRLSSSDPAVQEEEILEFVGQAMNAGKENVIIKAEKSVKHREVSRVARAVGMVEGASLYVAVLETQ